MIFVIFFYNSCCIFSFWCNRRYVNGNTIFSYFYFFAFLFSGFVTPTSVGSPSSLCFELGSSFCWVFSLFSSLKFIRSIGVSVSDSRIHSIGSIGDSGIRSVESFYTSRARYPPLSTFKSIFSPQFVSTCFVLLTGFLDSYFFFSVLL